MRFYVASKFENKEAVGHVIEKLGVFGHQVTYDWRYAKVNDMDQAVRDYLGVEMADFVVGIFEKDAVYKGAIAEIGMAIAWQKPIFIIGNWLDNMIFMKLPTVIKVTDTEDIIQFLLAHTKNGKLLL